MTTNIRRVIAALAITSTAVLSPVARAQAEPMEDQPGWSCVDDGNRVCGPENSEGKPAGCYDDGGVLWAPWPCAAWTPADGYRHGDGSVTR